MASDGGGQYGDYWDYESGGVSASGSQSKPSTNKGYFGGW